jgi:hypothetical protein
LVEVYAVAALLVLAMLGWEILFTPDFRRLARRTWVLGTLALCALVFWNPEAWIVRANVARYRLTGELDAPYLVYRLGPDGLPEFARSLVTLDPPYRQELENCVRRLVTTQRSATARYRWFEWTVRRKALKQMFEQYRYEAGAGEQPEDRAACRAITRR